jgi:hypothetical protein
MFPTFKKLYSSIKIIHHPFEPFILLTMGKNTKQNREKLYWKRLFAMKKIEKGKHSINFGVLTSCFDGIHLRNCLGHIDKCCRFHLIHSIYECCSKLQEPKWDTQTIIIESMFLCRSTKNKTKNNHVRSFHSSIVGQQNIHSELLKSLFIYDYKNCWNNG